MADLNKIYTGMAQGPEKIDENFREIPTENVSLEGDQTINGQKTFTETPIMPIAKNEFDIGYDIKINAKRSGNLVTISLDALNKTAIPAGLTIVSKQIPKGYLPIDKEHLNFMVQDLTTQLYIVFDKDGKIGLLTSDSVTKDHTFKGVASYFTKDTFPINDIIK